MKHSVILLLWLACSLVSCYDDKGNYDYIDIDELTITGIPEEPLAALQKVENLVVTPTVTSKFEGVISADNPNYEFTYTYNRGAGGDFLTPSLLDSAMVKDLNIPTELDPGNYTAWFKVKDLRTGIVTSAEFKIEVTTATSKGWLVLCEEEGGKIRVDMLGETGNRIAAVRNLFDFLPEQHRALQLYMESHMLYTGSVPYLNLYTGDGSYRLNVVQGVFNRTSYGDPRGIEFARKIDDIIVAEAAGETCMVITSEGDAYHRTSGNSVYDVKINVDVPLAEPVYKVAPFIGYRWTDYGYTGILYDITNKAFKYFSSYPYGDASLRKCLYNPKDPEDAPKLFEWKTGKDMVYMAGTAQGNGLVFALMKDASGQFSIYGITVGGQMTSPDQTSYVDIDATTASRLTNATCYAFHPTLPFLLYNSDSDIYLYDIATQTNRRVSSLSGETISMLKFHKLPLMGYNYPEAAVDCQYRLAVGSAKTGAEAGSEGILRFYDVPEFAADLTQYGEAYSGFGVIKDIAYKAR